MSKRWIDITQPLTNQIATWPGDTPFHFEVAHTKEQTGSVNIGQITASVHTGTHADAPFHFNSSAATIEQLDVNHYIGPAKVIDVTGIPWVGQEELMNFDLDGVRRLILKTKEKVQVEKFPEDFTLLKEDIGEFLQNKGIFLLGLDIPSVDAADSKDLPIHHTLYKNGVHILENLYLQDVSAGDYELIALPLKIVGADGSPVRAVLRKM
ncbi:arylformamidase [Psychrobacillus sp. Sa2BUA9]|uniref:Kynurenine formamidase n=1 Tax=Psychrobacillus faecigallinarum TaxID=2762235 RepID=A0ABR8RDY7_9BACI|nr:arylformamidase [Psychrobacillus faecigallinarum]MBD7945992.1 arylformamidase [Psychrobacillus faecigallinarum]